MKKAIGFWLALMGMLGMATTAVAHHGTAGYYDREVLVRLEGVVVEFRFRNPHAALFVASKNDAGEEVIFSLEMASPGQLAKAGYTRRTFTPGDKVVVEMNPAFNSDNSGQLFIGRGSIWINGELAFAADEEE